MPKRKQKPQESTDEEPVSRQAPVVSSESLEVTSWQGPIPPPNLLQGYESLLPGAADRIFSMAEKQAAHRMDLEATVIVSDSRRSWVGLVFAFIITLTALAGAIFLIYHDKNVAGLIIAMSALAGLVGAFVYGTNARRAERSKKASTMPQVRRPGH